MTDDRIDRILNVINELKLEFREFKTSMLGKLESKEKECLFHTQKVKDIEKILHGNGRKGIKDRIEELEKFKIEVIAYATVISSIIVAFVNFLFKYFFN